MRLRNYSKTVIAVLTVKALSLSAGADSSKVNSTPPITVATAITPDGAMIKAAVAEPQLILDLKNMEGLASFSCPFRTSLGAT